MNMALRRIYQELTIAKSLEDCGIFVFQDETNAMRSEAIICGPSDTPYEGGFFHFVLDYPSNYPSSSPKVILHTTSGGTVRFNPNLYACGKVCLSILGTWEGPGWTAAMQTSTVLLSIQSLMGEYPLLNEPGWSTCSNREELDCYNSVIRHETLRVAAIGNALAILNGTSTIPVELHQHVIDGFVKNLEFYESVIKAGTRSPNEGKRMRDPFGSDRGHYNYALLSQRIGAMTSAITQRSSALNCKIPNSGLLSDRSDLNSSKCKDLNADITKPIILDSLEIQQDLGKSLNGSKSSFNGLPSELEEVSRGSNDDDALSIPDGLKCGVCFDLLATAAVFLCGHVCCFVCAHTWMQKSETCPICRRLCEKKDLHRVFNMDSLTEMHSKICFPGEDNHFMKIWIERKELGIKLAAGEALQPIEPSRWDTFPNHGISSHFDSVGNNSASDDGYDNGSYDDGGYSYGSGFSYYGSGYFQGVGYKLGSEPSIHVDNISPSLPATITVDDSITDEEIAMQLAKKESLREARLKKIQTTVTKQLPDNFTSNSASSSPLGSMPSLVKSPIQVVESDEFARLQALKRANAEQESKKLDRKRLQIELAQDREARKANKGILPANHEPLLSKDPVAIPSGLLNAAMINKASGLNSVKSSSLKSQESLEVIRYQVKSAKQSASDVHAALTVVQSILKNILKNPQEIKFRSVNTSGKTFKEKVSHIIGIAMLFRSLGFVKSPSAAVTSTHQTDNSPSSFLSVTEPDLSLFEEISNSIELFLCELAAKIVC